MRERLQKAILKKGYFLSKSSKSNKDVSAFEKGQISKKLFNIIKQDPIYRVIGFFLFKKSIVSTDELIQKIVCSNLEYTLGESIIKKSACSNCEKELLFLRIDQEPNVRCQNCGGGIKRIKDEWNFKKNEVFLRRALFHYLERLKDTGLVSRDLNIYCPLCFSGSEYIGENKIHTIKKLICDKCKGFKEIRWIYTPPIEVSDIWDEKGTWLEWYVKNLLVSNGFNVLQGITIRDKDKQELEVDCLFLNEKDKIISIECRAKAFNNTYEEEPDISKLFPFSDYVILVTTTKISNPLKSRYLRLSPRCKKIFVDGNELERLPEIIAKECI